LLEKTDAAWDRYAYSQVQRNGFAGHTVRTPRWRYTEWDDGLKGLELYDHERNPGEMHNLANDPAYASVIAELKAAVKKNWPTRVTGGVAADGQAKAKKAKKG
jgi:uncharacterized sulfatase